MADLTEINWNRPFHFYIDSLINHCLIHIVKWHFDGRSGWPIFYIDSLAHFFLRFLPVPPYRLVASVGRELEIPEEIQRVPAQALHSYRAISNVELEIPY